SLSGTCCLNNVEPEKWLCYVIEHIQGWPVNRVKVTRLMLNVPLTPHSPE
ncbi:transposase domain-containing protein, partial [Escherichia coli]